MTNSLIFSQENSGYFQQRCDYNINVSLNDNNHSLKGDISILYQNNSNDSLNFILIHLYPNAYKNNKTDFAKQFQIYGKADFHFAKESKRGYIDSLFFTVNGNKAEYEFYEKKADIAKLHLPKTLLPGEKIRIHTPFHIKIPNVFSRLGHVNQSYYITQWYPKPAVYDQDGWHPQPYLHMGEYYSEYGDFNVSIDLPKNYRLAATGKLKNPAEKNWLINLEDRKEKTTPKSSSERKTVRYTAKNVHDFAWFADKRYCVRHSLYNDSIDVFAFFLPESKPLWADAIRYISQAVDFYSTNIGNSHYPSYTAVEGAKGAGGGMEYPGITLISGSMNKRTLEQVIMHEVGHNWFYGILGFNERDYPWLDEGFNSFYEKKYLEFYYPDDPNNIPSVFKSDNPYLSEGPGLLSEFIYKYTRSIGIDQAADLSSNEYHFINYYSVIYNKTVSAIYYLEAWIGEEKLTEMMKSFYTKWSNKHPSPEDLKQHFESKSGEDLSWFFDGLIGSTDNVDYKINSFKNDSIEVINRGKINAPLFYGNKNKTYHSEGFEGRRKFEYNDDNSKLILIDPDYKMLEFNRSNDKFRKGFINHLNTPKLKFFAGIDNPDYSETYLIPVPLVNGPDGFMPGLLIYNGIIPVKSFEYRLMPLFALKSNIIAGLGELSFRKNIGDGLFSNLELRTYAKQFSLSENTHYQKLSATLNLDIRTNKPNTKLNLFINQITTSTSVSKPMYYQQIGANYSDNKAINPFNASLSMEHGAAYYKIEVDSRYHINYNDKFGLDIEVFGGYLNYYDFENHPYNVNFRLSGTSSHSDYLYTMNHLSRNTNISNSKILSAHQFIPDEGGFALYTPIQSNDWMGRIRLVSETPVGFLNIYGSAAFVPDIDNYDEKFAFYEAGIEVSVIKDVLEIYIPVFYSEKLRQINEGIYTENFWQKIRFHLSLDKINPFELRYKPELLY